MSTVDACGEWSMAVLAMRPQRMTDRGTLLRHIAQCIGCIVHAPHSCSRRGQGGRERGEAAEVAVTEHTHAPHTHKGRRSVHTIQRTQVQGHIYTHYRYPSGARARREETHSHTHITYTYIWRSRSAIMERLNDWMIERYEIRVRGKGMRRESESQTQTADRDRRQSGVSARAVAKEKTKEQHRGVSLYIAVAVAFARSLHLALRLFDS